MIILADAHIELEIRPKLPENATKERQTEIMEALAKMLYDGTIYSGQSEARVEWVRSASTSTLVMKVRIPDGRFELR